MNFPLPSLYLNVIYPQPTLALFLSLSLSLSVALCLSPVNLDFAMWPSLCWMDEAGLCTQFSILFVPTQQLDVRATNSPKLPLSLVSGKLGCPSTNFTNCTLSLT